MAVLRYRAWNTDVIPVDKKVSFMRTTILPAIIELFENAQLTQPMIEDNSWLQEFSKFDSTTREMDKAFRTTPNDVIIVLLEFVDAFYSEILARTRLIPFLIRLIETDKTMSDQDPLSVADVMEMSVVTQECASWASIQPEWRLLCTRVGQFCLRAGSPSVTYEPHKDIKNLHHRALPSGSYLKEAYLEAEVKRLEDLCRTQQRMITSLSFRSALEALPGPRLPGLGGRLISSAAHWKQFWDRAWASRSSANHPFGLLLEEFGQQNHRQIEMIGGDLYNHLSTNIHHSRSEFPINDDQWDVLVAAILYVLTPTSARMQDGSVDWDLERKRFKPTVVIQEELR